MKVQRFFRLVSLLVLLAMLSGVVGAVTLVGATAQSDGFHGQIHAARTEPLAQANALYVGHEAVAQFDQLSESDSDWARDAASFEVKAQIDPNPPDRTLKLVFVHASVGWNWLLMWLGGQKDDPEEYWNISLGGNNYNVRDYNTHVVHPIQIDHGYCDWYDVFTNETNLQMLFDHNEVETTWEGQWLYDPIDPDDTGENDIIMIKPCFIDYPIYGSPNDPPTGLHGCPLDPGVGEQKTVGNVKQVMIDILEVFRQHPNKFFVLVTAPPLPHTDPNTTLYGANARAVANWMVHEWLDGYDVGNVMVWDLYNVLTSNTEGEGDTCQERIPGNPESNSDVLLETGNHHRVWNNQIQHQWQYHQEYSAYSCTADPHPPTDAQYKMTREFVPLLNARVNAWLAGEPLPTATLTPSATPTVTSTPTNTPTPTATPIPTVTPSPPCDLPGDLNCDCAVDMTDIMLVANCWGTSVGADDYNPAYDLDGDGDIDIVDIMLVAVHWGETCEG